MFCAFKRQFQCEKNFLPFAGRNEFYNVLMHVISSVNNLKQLDHGN